MGWWWKLTGGMVGASLGGPVGATVGAILGHALDSIAESDSGPAGASASAVGTGDHGRVAHQLVALRFVRETTSLLAHVASANGPLRRTEATAIRNIVQSLYSAKALGISTDDLSEVVDSSLRLPLDYSDLVESARSNPSWRLTLLGLCWQVASADIEITPREIRSLRAVADALGATLEEFDAVSVRYFRTEHDSDRRAAARLLEVPLDATPDDICAAYRRLSMRWHPDRFPHVSPETKAQAADRFVEITHAKAVLLGTPRASCSLFGRAVDGGRIYVPNARDVVSCFFCGTHCRLPEHRWHVRSRCARCKSLLLFEEALARDLKDVLRTNKPQPSQRCPRCGFSYGVVNREGTLWCNHCQHAC